jgi:hypothetical protein
MGYKLVRRSIKNNKRGSLVDMVFISVMIFAFAITCIIGYSILQKYNEQISGENTMSDLGKNISLKAQTDYGNVFDGIMVFIFMGLAVALMVSVMVIKTHPGFLWVSLFLLVIFGVLFFVMQEAWKEVSEEDLFINQTNATASFPITDYLMNNFLVILLVISSVGIMVMYAKFGGGWN